MKAVMLSVNYEKEDVRWQFHDMGNNPILTLKGLWDSIKDDWPGYETVVDGDEEARKAWAEWYVPRMLGKA